MSAPSAQERRRETCLWLARRAAFRPGLLLDLADRFGDFDTLIDQPLKAIAAAATRRRRARAVAGANSEAAVLSPAADPFSLAERGKGAGLAPAGLVTYVDDLYPSSLKELPDPPPALWVAGAEWQRHLEAMRASPLAAVVGARGPSSYGLEMATTIASGVAAAGVGVVSGLALGIDAAAHQAALRAAPGGVPLVAVLGGGIDVVHPRANASLRDDILERGVLVSEYGVSLPAVPWRFPARNRIIAALASTVVIVEGRSRSGALYTAEYALDLGRDVLAVPGEAGRRLSAAPHTLLRAGAGLCEGAADVLASLPQGLAAGAGVAAEHGGVPAPASWGAPGTRESEQALDDGPRRVLAALRDAPAGCDDLADRLGMDAGAILGALGLLDVAGLVSADTGGRYRAVVAGSPASAWRRVPVRVVSSQPAAGGDVPSPVPSQSAPRSAGARRPDAKD